MNLNEKGGFVSMKRTSYCAPHRTAPHRTAPHRTAPHRTATMYQTREICRFSLHGWGGCFKFEVCFVFLTRFLLQTDVCLLIVMSEKSLEQPSSITCIVPCLNEAANLGVLVPGLIAAVSPLTSAFEIIVVDDGSTDGTADLLETLTRRYPQVVYLQLSRNFGKEAALSAGL